MPADQDIVALVTDFFDWLETVWQLPIADASQVRKALLVPHVLIKEAYTVKELKRLYDLSDGAHGEVRRLRLAPVGYAYALGRPLALYRKEDLAPSACTMGMETIAPDGRSMVAAFFSSCLSDLFLLSEICRSNVPIGLLL